MNVRKRKRNDKILQSQNARSIQENKGLLKLSDNKRSLQYFVDGEDQPKEGGNRKKAKTSKMIESHNADQVGVASLEWPQRYR